MTLQCSKNADNSESVHIFTKINHFSNYVRLLSFLRRIIPRLEGKPSQIFETPVLPSQDDLWSPVN